MRTRPVPPLRTCGIPAGILALTLAAGASTVAAQSSVLRGVVADTTGAPVAGADVRVVGMPYLTRTDEQGRFVFRFLPDGPLVLSIRRVGFVPFEVPARAPAGDTLSLVMRVQPSQLSPVEVAAPSTRRRVGIEGFHERRARGLGTYITREEILARSTATRPSDILRNTPGVRIVRADGGSGIRFTSGAIVRRDCMPMMWVDGQRAPGMEIDQISLHDIEGIELYAGPSTTPMQFSHTPSGTTCGTIVLWTRNPGL